METRTFCSMQNWLINNPTVLFYPPSMACAVRVRDGGKDPTRFVNQAVHCNSLWRSPHPLPTLPLTHSPFHLLPSPYWQAGSGSDGCGPDLVNVRQVRTTFGPDLFQVPGALLRLGFQSSWECEGNMRAGEMTLLCE